MREWLIYVGVMAIVLALLFRNDNMVGAFAGLLVSGPLYLLFGFVLAKLGYQRKSLKDLRTPQAESTSSKPKGTGKGGDSEASARPRPAPTKRTSGGGNRPKSKPRRR